MRTLARLLEESGCELQIGLRAQGKFNTVMQLRLAHKSWDEIGRAIGWSGEAVNRSFVLEAIDELGKRAEENFAEKDATIARLTAERDFAVRSAHSAWKRGDAAEAALAAERQRNEKLTAEADEDAVSFKRVWDDWQAERQQIAALREARQWHKSAQGVNEEEAAMASRRLIELLDALGFTPVAPPREPKS
jgi:hypothetical protein